MNVRDVARSGWRALASVPVIILLLGGAATASIGAWAFQASAAADFGEARVLQGRDIASSGVEPPSPEQNREIIANLDRGISVRRQIDTQLQSIEASVAALSEQQTLAGEVTNRALEEVRLIARSLGGANEAASSAVGRLGSLRQQLKTSVRLARLIAEELEELDRKMGPDGGRPR